MTFSLHLMAETLTAKRLHRDDTVSNSSFISIDIIKGNSYQGSITLSEEITRSLKEQLKELYGEN